MKITALSAGLILCVENFQAEVLSDTDLHNSCDKQKGWTGDTCNPWFDWYMQPFRVSYSVIATVCLTSASCRSVTPIQT